MSMCDECIYLPVNDPEKTGEDSYTWSVMNPCSDCLNTYNQPSGFMHLKVSRARELLGMIGDSDE